ncbi:hypothetical protein ACGH7X_16890 [Streptomyces sp. BBFR51]|uniref:hypothetical protein n=1 Tax=Streptomyces sp. BBFR51 TaxID=3372856 RepID=UPI0037DD828F
MTTRGRALRFTAISALVVLSLTGFSTGRHGHGHGGDGGGGCSSSSQDHDSSSSTSGGGDAYKDDDTYGSGGSGYHDYDDDTYDDDTGSGGSGGNTGGAEPATLELITCATESDPYATVEITNPNATEYTFAVTVFFKDAADTTISDGREETTVPARGVTKVRVPLDGSAAPDHCELDDTEPLPLS